MAIHNNHPRYTHVALALRLIGGSCLQLSKYILKFVSSSFASFPSDTWMFSHTFTAYGYSDTWMFSHGCSFTHLRFMDKRYNVHIFWASITSSTQPLVEDNLAVQCALQ